MKRKNLQANVIIIGGGPGGLAALSWCVELGLRPLLFEGAANLGGQLLSIFNPVTNYPGRQAANGREFRDHYVTTIKGVTEYARTGQRVLTLDGAQLTVTLEDGSERSAQSIIVATGVRRRKLGVPGETEFEGRGILLSGARDPRIVDGKHVAVIGGGDAALENALILSEHARKVTVIHRRDAFRARPEFVAAADERGNIDLSLNTEVTAIDGDDRVRALSLHGSSGPGKSLPVELVLVRIGFVPNSEIVRGQLDLDENGFLNVDELCQTSLPGIYGIGDVANAVAPTISTAAGMAATAVKAIKTWLI